MIRNILTILPLATVLACQSPQADTTIDTDNQIAATSSEAEGEWVPLFDGKTTNGWHTYGQNDVGNAWEVKDGALHLDPSNKTNGGGDLVTDQAFEDFDLKLEWKISEGGNSGIIFYVHEDTTKYDETWNTGLEMQVVDNERHPDAKIKKHRAGDLYDLIAANPESVKPAGEWNQVEIISNDGHLELYLNDAKVVTTTLWDDNWKELVAGSKFAPMPGFGTYKSGKIALQDHGDEVWFRNIMIKRL